MPTMDIPATVFKTWIDLKNYLMSVGVDLTNLPSTVHDVQSLVEYCSSIGVELRPIYKNVLDGFVLVSTEAANSAESTDIVVRGVTDLVVAGGSATTLKRGKVIFGSISKALAAVAIAGAVFISSTASAIQQHLSELADGLSLFEDENGDIPVMIDENGNTFFDERIINAFREKAAEMGVFESGGFIPDTNPVVINTTITVPNLTFKDVFDTEVLDMMLRCARSRGISESIVNSYKSTIWNILNGERYTWTNITDGYFQGNFSSFLNMQLGGFLSRGTSAQGYGALIPIATGEYTLNKSITINNIETVTLQTIGNIVPTWCKPNNTATNKYMIDYKTITGYLDRQFRIIVPGVGSNQPQYVEFAIGNGDGQTSPMPCIVLRCYPNSYVWNSGSGSGDVEVSQEMQLVLQGTNTYYTQITPYYDKTRCDTGYFFNGTIGSGGVPGLTPSNPTVGDLTQQLTDIFPDWAENTITMPAPTDEDLTNTVDFYPVSINNTEPYTTDHTATSADQEGDTTDDAKDKIIEQLMTLVQSLLQNPDNPDEVITPTIPVGDSGDTPPATPTVISGASNGLWTIYNPTLGEVQQFGGWLWSESLIDQIIRQFNNPIEAVIGFMSIYCTPITGDRKVIKAGYLSSPVSAKEVTNQYVTINCGQVEVPEYYHTAVDYTRSKVEIFLPFIGIVPLDCSVVTGSTLEVIYRIDVLTGTCLAQIKVIKQNSDAVMYTYPGNCAVQLPLTASTYTGMVGAIMGAISGGFALGMGDVGGGIKKLGEGLVSGMSNLSGTAKSGNLSSNAGALGIRIPYLIITHPTVYDAMIYNQFYGYPSNVYQRLSAMSGFVRVKDIHLDSISCTEQERDMIYTRLKEGVIIS